MRRILIALVVVVGLGSNAWGMSLFDQSKKIEALEAEIADMKIKNDAATVVLRGVYERQQELLAFKEAEESANFSKGLAQREAIRFFFDFPQKAVLSPAIKDFSIMTSKGGLASVACKNVKAYSTGSEVTLELVNFYAVSLTSVELTIEYSTESIFMGNAGDAASQADKFEKNKKTTKKKISSLPSGRAISVTISMPEYTPENLKYIGVSMEVGGMEFYRK